MKYDTIAYGIFGLFVILGIIGTGVILAHKSIPAAEWAVVEQTKQQMLHQGLADEVVNKMFYIKDPRTSLCYAYYWGGLANGGPALATVPESSIPTNLLWTAHINK